MVISLVYAPFPRCRVHKGNRNGRIVSHHLVWLVMKLVVAQFYRAKDHEIINEGAVCVVRKRDAVFTVPPAKLRACHRIASCLVGVSLASR